MGTLIVSYIYAHRDGYDECMRAGSLKTNFLFNPLHAGNPKAKTVMTNLCMGAGVSKTPMFDRFCMCISDRLLLQPYS